MDTVDQKRVILPLPRARQHYLFMFVLNVPNFTCGWLRQYSSMSTQGKTTFSFHVYNNCVLFYKYEIAFKLSLFHMVRDFSSKKPGGFEHIQFCNWHLIWLPRSFVQWSKHWQLIAEWKRKWSQGGRPGWLEDVFGAFVTTSLSLLSFDSFWFVRISSVLDKESSDLKVLAMRK